MRAPSISWSFTTAPSDEPEGSQFCAITLERIAARWTVEVLGALERRGCLRYHEIQETCGGITQRMLTKALRHLERDGLVTRTKYTTFPPRVDYELTEMGRGLAAELRAVRVWLTHHAPEIRAAQERFGNRDRTEPV